MVYPPLVAKQLMIIEDGAPAQEFLNQALKEDALDDSYVYYYGLDPCLSVTNAARYYAFLSTMPLEISNAVPSTRVTIGEFRLIRDW